MRPCKSVCSIVISKISFCFLPSNKLENKISDLSFISFKAVVVGALASFHGKRSIFRRKLKLSSRHVGALENYHSKSVLFHNIIFPLSIVKNSATKDKVEINNLSLVYTLFFILSLFNLIFCCKILDDG